MGTRLARLSFAIVGLIAALYSAGADVGGGTKASIARGAEGRYEHRDQGTGKILGTEAFRLTVHSDGSRCIQIWSNGASRGSQITSNVCVDGQFRPTEAYARYWIAGAYRGSGWIRVERSELRLVSANAQGAVTESETEVPEHFSIGTHPISADAWHVAAMQAADTRQAVAYTFNPSGSGTQPLTGALVPIPVERLADEKVVVPAGTFDARQFRLSGQMNYWVAGADWIVVKSAAGSAERVLVEYREF